MSKNVYLTSKDVESAHATKGEPDHHLMSNLLNYLLGFLILFQATSSNQVSFSIKNAGLTVNGSVGGLRAKVILDTLQPANSEIRASVEVATLQTGIAARDRHLLKQDYFDAAKYPYMILQSKNIRYLGKGKFEGVFELEIKGIKKQIKIDFYKKGQSIYATFKINRLEFKVGESSWLLSDEVSVKLNYPLP